MQQFDTPILLIGFNRADKASKVFEVIRGVRPRRLYIAVDGPRPSVERENSVVGEVRKIFTDIDWPCQTSTLFPATNLGCKLAVSNAINWLFENEEQGIILEDDCLPHPDFFPFCQNLLQRYAKDCRVSAITGCNFQDGTRRGDVSYYFSRYNHVWGWASWRRAWKLYDLQLSFWPSWRGTSHWRSLFGDAAEERYWRRVFETMYLGKVDTWDYAWTASIWRFGGLTATPNVNLVSNIGFDSQATHTAEVNSPMSALGTEPIGVIHHPIEIERNATADNYTFRNVFMRSKRRLLLGQLISFLGSFKTSSSR